MKVHYLFLLAASLVVLNPTAPKALAAQPYGFKGKMSFKNLTGSAFDIGIVAKDTTDVVQFVMATTIPDKGSFKATGLPQNGTCTVTYDYDRDGNVDYTDSFPLYTSYKLVLRP